MDGDAFAIGDGGGRRLAESREGDLDYFSPAGWIFGSDVAAAGLEMRKPILSSAKLLAPICRWKASHSFVAKL